MFQLQFDLSCEIRENKLIPVFSDIETVSVYILMQMFPLMRTFAIIGILLVNVYSTKKYLVEVGNERSEEDEASEHTEEDEATEHTKEEDIKQNLEVGMDDGLQFRMESK